MKTKIGVGKSGEAKAVDYLRQNGYKILERNFRNKLGEIDIVAQENNVICFIEVRTRQGICKHDQALESIDSRKQQRLSRMAVSFLKERHLLEHRARFDVVSVILSEPEGDVKLLKDAFPVTGKYS